MEKNQKKIATIILIIIVILIIIAIGITMYIKNYSNTDFNEKENEITKNSITEIEKSNTNIQQNAITNKIESMGERNRIQTYYGEFITSIEKKDYDSAYNMLNDNFKNNYFQTADKFTEYIKSKYPTDIITEYTSFDRQGELYVVTVKLSDAFDKTYTAIEQRIVIRENGANDFKISFQVL